MHVQEFSGISNTSSTTCTATVPAGGIPAGDLLVLGIETNATALPSITVTDTAGNTWILDGQIQTAASGSAHQFRTVLTDALNAGDTITVTLAAALSRIAVSVQHFDDSILAIDNGANGNNGGASSSSPTTDLFGNSHADCLIVGTMGIVSAARTFTAGTDYTAGTKVATTNGSGDRAVIMQWQYVSAIDDYVSNGTFNTGSLYGAVARAYALGDPGAPAGSGKLNVHSGGVGGSWGLHPAKTHNGTAWQTHTAKRHDGIGWVPTT